MESITILFLWHTGLWFCPTVGKVTDFETFCFTVLCHGPASIQGASWEREDGCTLLHTWENTDERTPYSSVWWPSLWDGQTKTLPAQMRMGWVAKRRAREDEDIVLCFPPRALPWGPLTNTCQRSSAAASRCWGHGSGDLGRRPLLGEGCIYSLLQPFPELEMQEENICHF